MGAVFSKKERRHLNLESPNISRLLSGNY